MKKGLIVLLIVIVIAGCTFPAESGYQIDFDGTVTTTDEGIHMTGEVEADHGTSPERTFTDVRLTFYNQKKEKIKQVYIGTISTHDDEHVNNRTINQSFNFVPSYIVLSSPDFWGSDSSLRFWEEPDTSVITFEKTEEDYRRYYVNNPEDRFPEDI